MRPRTADGTGAGTSAKIYINFKIMLFLDKNFSFLRRFQTHIPLLYYLTKRLSSKSSFQLIFSPFSAFSAPFGSPKTSLPDVATSPGGPYGVSRTRISDFFDVRKRPRFSAVRASRGHNNGLMTLQRGRRCNAVRAPLQPREGLTAGLFLFHRKTAGTPSFVNG